jgi:hypothetical protein
MAQAQQQAGKAAQKADPTQQSLQRLDFLKSYTEFAVNKSSDIAGSVYATSRSFTPSFLEPQVQAVEGKAKEVASNYGAPIVNAVQDKSSQVLGVVDKQVDGVVKRAEEFYSNNSTFLSNAVKNQSDYHAKNLQHFKDARDAYLKQAKDAVNFLKKEGVSGTAKAAVDSLLATVEQAKGVPNYLNEQANFLLEKVSVAWEKLSSVPAVQKTLDAVSPAVEQAKKKYIEAHDLVVTAPVYNKAVDTGADVLTKVQTTYVYKTAANRLYPVISPYADPVIEKVSHSPYVNGVIDHLKPQHTVNATA